MSLLNHSKMIYRNFGNSGLKVSVISIGNMINFKPETYEQDKEIIKVALQNGINHIDTAEVYAAGQAQTQLGKILKDLKVDRQDVVIATKVHTAPQPQRNSQVTNNRKHIRQSVKKSLIRLQMDYVDIIYAHMHDFTTPLEQICRGFNQVIEQGQAFYWATSNWPAQVVFNALAICQKLNLHKPIGTQSQYNMFKRADMQINYESLFTKYNYGLIGWSPLAGGFLTGKYFDGIPEDQVGRFNDKNSPFPLQLMKSLFYTPHANQKNLRNLKQLDQLSKEHGFRLIHLALAWAIKYQHLDSALIGARNVNQLNDSLRSMQFLQKLTPQLQAKVNKILDTTPTPRNNFIAWKPYDPIRKVQA